MHGNLMSILAVVGSLTMFWSPASAENQKTVETPALAGMLDTSGTGYMRVAHFADFDLGEDFTIEVRASFDRFQGHQEILSKTTAWDQDGFVFKWLDNRLQFIRGGQGGKVKTGKGAFSVASASVSDLEPGRLYDLALVKTQHGVTFYIDGEAVGSRKIEPLVANAADLKLSTPWAKGHLAGKVDELRIWRQAFAAGEIANHTDEQVQAEAPGLLTLFSFDGETGGTAKNKSRPNRPGKLIGKAVLTQPAVIPAAMPSEHGTL
jgi:hypothetical protein